MNRIIRTLIIGSTLALALVVWQGKAEAARCYLFSEDVGYVCDAQPAPPMFVEPRPIPDSFLEHSVYARLKDNINVYSAPNPGAAVTRNVGDGFLFSTISSIVTGDDGNTWYQINYGEYVRSDDASLVYHSDFTGVEVKEQPQRPFGWVVQEFTPSNAPDTAPDPNATKISRYTLFEVYGAATDAEGWIWYDIGGGRWMKQTFASLVDVTPKPEGVGDGEYWVEVDLYEQSFAAYVGNRMVYASLISSGLNRWPTHEGLFQVWDRHEKTKMSGAEGKVDYYFIEDVPHTMFFDEDIALHGAYWHDRFGFKHSHGCVNMPPRAAEWVFNWSATAPNALWVFVHTSNPNHYFTQLDQTLDPEQPFAGP